MEFDFGENFKTVSERLLEIKQEREARAEKALKFHISFLDDIALGILPTDLIVIGAATGAGKTTLGVLLAQRAAMAGTRVHYFALEAHHGEIEQRVLYREMADNAWAANLPGREEMSYAHWVMGRCKGIADVCEERARRHLFERLSTMTTFYRTGDFTAKRLVGLIGSLRGQTDLVIVDHLHFIDSSDDDENRGMKSIVKAISDSVQDTEIPVIAIAHLRKRDLRRPRLIPELDEFHGSSDIVKIATKAIVLAPARDIETEEPHLVNTYMRVAKDRLVGDQGLTALVRFNLQKNMYESSYALGRVTPSGDEWKQLERKPWWAKNAKNYSPHLV